MTRSLRRRLDYQVLRWQARLDGAWADRVIPWIATVGLALVLAALALARARSLETGNDLAAWVQGAWLVTEGRQADLSVTGRHLLEPQFAAGFYAVAQVTRVLGAVPALLLLQSVALALGLPAVWRLCRQVCTLRVGAAVAAVFAYAAHPLLHQLNLADFHPVSLAVPALLWGAYFAFRGRWRWAVPLFVVAVLMRSDAGLTVAAIGIALAVGGHGRGGRRLALGGLAWTLVAQFAIQPAIGDGSFVHQDAFAAYGDNVPGVVWGMASSPLEVLGDLVARENFEVLVALLAPVLFVPVLAPRRLLPFAPVVALFFVADVPIDGPAGAELLAPAVVGVFASLPFALGHLGRRNIERVTVDRRILVGLAMAAAAFFCLESPSSPYADPWEWGGRDAADQTRMAVADLVADDRRVRAAPSLMAEMAERRVLRPVPVDHRPSASELVAGVDTLVLDTEVLERWQVDDAAARAELESDLLDEGVDLVLERNGIRVFRRNGE